MGDDGKTLRIVILGPTGTGKSSLANSLLGKTAPRKDAEGGRDAKDDKDPTEGFNTGHGLKSETMCVPWDKADRFGVTLEVTDTPGLCDTQSPEKLINKEVAKILAVADPGPHVIIFALQCERLFTREEYGAYTKIKQMFSADINKHLIVVFNRLDAFSDKNTIDGQRAVLAEEIKKCASPLKEMIEEAGGRYFGMNNKTSPAEIDRQFKDLIKMMQDLVRKNRYRYYKTEMTEQITRNMEELVRQEASNKGISQSEAIISVKRKISQDEISPWAISNATKQVREGSNEKSSV